MHLKLSEIKSSVFPGGEVHISLTPTEKGPVVNLECEIHNSDDIMKILLVTDALRRQRVSDIHLWITYTPYARQDRVCNPGEALSIKVFADLINSQNYKTVHVFDPHSDVTPALLNNCVVHDNHKFIRNVLDHMKVDVVTIVSPDAGSNKKIKDLLVYLSDHETKIKLVKCDKTRDLKTGKLSGFEVYGKVKGHCLIIDDICDGGGTFNGLAEELRKKGASELSLAVSHGIFSKGFEELSKNFTQIYTTDSFRGQRDEKLVTNINI